VIKRDETACSDKDIQCRLNSQHNWDDQNNVTKHKILHFDNERDIHTSSINYEESGHGLYLDLLTISYESPF
jgi:hypothetical protein